MIMISQQEPSLKQENLCLLRENAWRGDEEDPLQEACLKAICNEKGDRLQLRR